MDRLKKILDTCPIKYARHRNKTQYSHRETSSYDSKIRLGIWPYFLNSWINKLRVNSLQIFDSQALIKRTAKTNYTPCRRFTFVQAIWLLAPVWSERGGGGGLIYSPDSHWRRERPSISA